MKFLQIYTYFCFNLCLYNSKQQTRLQNTVSSPPPPLAFSCFGIPFLTPSIFSPVAIIMSHLVQPTILLLKDGSEQAQGKDHVIHNINACQTVSEIVRTTLGPRGMDKLIYTQNGNVTISNDGRTIIDLLDIVHPAARTMVDIAIAQDNQVGDGTTSVVIISAELLKQAKAFIEDGVHPQLIIKAFRRAQEAVSDKLDQLAIDHKSEGY
ncbi:chaperonin containing TCP1 eta subunit, partial [Reticulomyxa filosa]